MKKIILFTTIIFGTIFSLDAQILNQNWLIDDGDPSGNSGMAPLTTGCGRTSSFWQQSNRLNFIPESTDPSFIVPINIIIVRKTDGTGNFTETLANDIFPDAVDLLNYHYDNLVEIDPSTYGDCFNNLLGEPVYVESVKIQFDLDTILFIDNDSYWGLTSQYPSSGLISHVESVLGTNKLNIYYTMQYQAWECLVNQNLLPCSCSQGSGYVNFNEAVATPPSETNMNSKPYVLTPNKYAQFIYGLNNYGWTLQGLIYETKRAFARTYEHELGHIFGLAHASISSHYDLNECEYSIMHQEGEVAAMDEPWLPPSEIGEMHRILHTSCVRRYVALDTYFPNNKYYSSSNQTWDYDLRLYSDLVVENNSTLTIQCNIYMPENADITVNPGSTLILDEDALVKGYSDNWQGTIHVKENAELIIKSYSTLEMSGNGQILIDYVNGAAGKLRYFDGGNIILSDYSTKLEIKGDLQLMAGAQFSTGGNGYVLFNSPLADNLCYNIIAGSNTSMNFTGTSTNHKKLEIAQPSLYTHGVNGVNAVKYISFANCKVVMSGSNSRLSLYRANYGSINLSNVTITSNTGNRTGHRGVALYGQTNIIIQNSVFSNGLYGIHAMLNYTDGAPLTLTNCAFYNNDRGLNVNDKGIILNYCTFDGNGYGVYADGMTFSSESNYSSYIYSTNDGINYTSASTGGLYVLYPLIMNNSNNGIAYSGATKLSVRCGDVRSNYKGITFSNNASLNMSQNENPIGGRVRMSVNTENNIYASNGNLLFLNSGYNNLQRNTNKMVISGNLGGYSACPTYLPAQYNRWNLSNISPAYGSDYSLIHNGTCRSKQIYLTDNSPTYATCSAPPPLSAGDNSFASTTTINTQNYINTTLPNALADAVNYIKNANYFTASDRLFEILNFPLLSTSAADDYYLNKAYLYMKENMAFILQNLVSDTSLTAQNTLANHVGKLNLIQNNIISKTQNDTNTYIRYYYTSLDKALLYRAIYDYDNALLHLNNILPWVRPLNAVELNKWICLTQLEKDVLDSIVRKEDFFELKQLCENNVLFKKAPDNSNNTLQTEESEIDNVVLNPIVPYIKVTPNPVTNQSLINVFVPDFKDDIAIRIFDVLGTIRSEIKIKEIRSTIRINNSSFKNGIYQFVLMQGNTVLDNVRVVFVKD